MNTHKLDNPAWHPMLQKAIQMLSGFMKNQGLLHEEKLVFGK